MRKEQDIKTSTAATCYADVALDYHANGFEPIPAKGKRPVPAGVTGRNGVVDEDRINALIADPEWAPQNVALRATPLEARIDVDDYGPKEGAKQLAELEARLGPLPATISSTSRGKDSDSRQHFFLLHEPVEMVGKAAADIEIIQRHHRYSLVFPSTNPDAYSPDEGYPMYRWYDADGEEMDRLPTLDDLEYLPEAWVEYLRHEQVDHAHQAEQWDGDLPDEATDTERRKLRAIIGRLEGLPDVWAPGAGWHDVVFSAACWLARISRSNAYHLTPDQALQVLIDHAPTYGSAWPVDRIIEQWESALTTTEGQYEEPPEEDRPPLLDGFTIIEAQARLPHATHDGRDFLTDGIGALPANDTPGALWAHRSRVIKALLASGFTDQEIATLVWMAPSARTLNEDLDGVRKLWAEVDEAKVENAAHEAAITGANVAPAPASERPDLTGRRPEVELLTLQERAYVESAECEWFGSRYLDYYRDVLPIMSEPYFRLNRWALLSGIFANRAIIPRNGESDLTLNLYMGMLGPTTSGKSESLAPLYEVWHAFFQGDVSDPDIGGGSATPQGLAKKLIDRDGATSFYRPDEADRVISDWKREMGPYSGMKQFITDAFGGKVSGDILATRSEASGKNVKAFLSVHMTGVPERVMAAVDPMDFSDGFLNRFIWAEGQKLPRTSKARRFNLRRDKGESVARPRMTAYWAAEFRQAVQVLQRPDGKPVEMDIADDVQDRYEEMVETLERLALGSKHPAELEPTFIRFGLTILKCAALVALSERRKVIEMRDFLIALHQGEEWAANAMGIVERAQETPWVKNLNYLESALASRPDELMSKSEVYRLMAVLQQRKRDVDELLDNLVAQGRVERRKRQDTGEEIVVLKGGAS